MSIYDILESTVSATDLVHEMEILNTDHPGIEIETAKIEMPGQYADAIFIPAFGRAGIVWGGDVEWTDASSMTQAVELWKNGEMVN